MVRKQMKTKENKKENQMEIIMTIRGTNNKKMNEERILK